MREVSRVLILKKSQMFAEEVRCILQDSWLRLSGCIYQNHLGHIDRVCPIRLFSKEPFVDIERLEVDWTDEATMTPAQLIAQREDLVCLALVFEPDQIAKEFIDYFLEEGALRHGCLRKE